MKTKMLFFAISLLSLFSCKKDVATGNTNTSNLIPESAVPAVVLTSFTNNFTTATEVEWRHSSDDNFVSQFNMEHQRHEADFDGSGHESSHTVISLDAAVPLLVLDAFRNNFSADKVYEWNLTNEGTWKAHFMRDAIKWETTLNSSGTVLKTEHD